MTVIYAHNLINAYLSGHIKSHLEGFKVFKLDVTESLGSFVSVAEDADVYNLGSFPHNIGISYLAIDVILYLFTFIWWKKSARSSSFASKERLAMWAVKGG